MNIITHALIGWTIAQKTLASRRDAALLTVVSVAPDLDGLGIIADFLAKGGGGPGPSYYESWHHVLCHNLFAGLAFALLAALLARRKAVVALGSLVLFHLHLLMDLVGSRGPEGDLWNIFYLFPANQEWFLGWQGQWEVNAWPNLVLTVVLLGISFKQARDLGFSPIWFLSAKADAAFVQTLRHRFPLTDQSG